MDESLPSKFSIGDKVFVRHFDEIDRSDIGQIKFDEENRKCYNIAAITINMYASNDVVPYTVCIVEQDFGTFIYRIKNANGRDAYWWAQGMLRSAYGDEELPEADSDGLFDLLMNA